MATKKKGTKVTKLPAKRKARSGSAFTQEIIVPEGVEDIRIELKVKCKKGKCCCPRTITFGISPIEPEEPGGTSAKKKKMMTLGSSPIEPEEPGG